MPPLRLTKDTTLCISIAERPGNFGTTLYNAAFQAKHLDFVYKALQVQPGQVRAAVNGVRALGIRGCGVSMPFKIEATKLVDSLDPWAKRIGAINTIVNTNGHLKGYNTDAFGAYEVLKSVHNLKQKSILLLGAGGVARAICAALAKHRAHNVTIVSRDPQASRRLAEGWRFATATWGTHLKRRADLFINATPLGMAPHANTSPLTKEAIQNYRMVMDVVIDPPETKLRQMARAAHKRIISGTTMSLYQAARQFELYTGEKAPVQLMKKMISQVHV